MSNSKGLPIDFLVGHAVPLQLASPRPTTIAASTTIRILIADDQTISRCGLRKLLETQTDFDVVGEATDPAEAVRWTHELKPDVLLVALSTHDWSGLDVLSQLTGSTVRTILLMPAIDTADTVKVLLVGARGVILKNSPMHLLFKSIRCVFRGEIWLGRDAMLDVVEAFSVLNYQRAEAPSSCLTAREKDVLTLVVSGYTNKDTARKLSISEDTVKHHLTSIFDKTGVSNRLELALFAIHHHFVGNP
jgi:two-component system, NarL family, nitrate/nitrite response regulator NarL